MHVYFVDQCHPYILIFAILATPPTCCLIVYGNERELMEGFEQRFVRLPSESVSLCAESVGVQVPQEITKTLVEDVSFRVRQIVDVSS